MKEKLLDGAFVLCLVGSVASALLARLDPSTRRDIDVLPSATEDIGEIRQGAFANAVFELRNSGPGPMRIIDVGTSCRCTVAEVSNREIEKGDSSRVTLKYYSGQSRGRVNVQAIVVYQRAGDQRSITLRARGEIDPDYNVSPELLEFDPNGPFVRRIELSPRHCREVRIEKVACDKRFFKAAVIASVDPARQEVEISFDPREYYADAGPSCVVVSTNNALQPLLQIPLTVTVGSDEHATESGKRGAF